MGSNASKRTSTSSVASSPSITNSNDHAKCTENESESHGVTISTASFGVAIRVDSFDSLKEVLSCFLEMNQEVAKVVLDCKDQLKCRELFELVNDYFDNSLKALNFYTDLDKCMKHADEFHSLVLLTFRQFEEEALAGDGYSKTSKELENLRTSVVTLQNEFSHICESIREKHIVMLDKLWCLKDKLDTKLRCNSAWRKVSITMFTATFGAVLTCSMVAAASAAPPLAAALSAATSIPLGSIGKWVDSLFREEEAELREQKAMINAMQGAVQIAFGNLDGIRFWTDLLERDIKGLVDATDVDVYDYEVAKSVLKDIDDWAGSFVSDFEAIEARIDVGRREISSARTMIIQKIISNSGNQ